MQVVISESLNYQLLAWCEILFYIYVTILTVFVYRNVFGLDLISLRRYRDEPGFLCLDLHEFLSKHVGHSIYRLYRSEISKHPCSRSSPFAARLLRPIAKSTAWSMQHMYT